MATIHDAMKQPQRRVYGRVEVSYSSPLRSSNIDADSLQTGIGSVTSQLFDSVMDPPFKTFATFDTDLTGSYKLSDRATQRGWHSNLLTSGVPSMWIGADTWLGTNMWQGYTAPYRFQRDTGEWLLWLDTAYWFDNDIWTEYTALLSWFDAGTWVDDNNWLELADPEILIEPVTLEFNFTARPIQNFMIVGDSQRRLYPVDFDLQYYKANGTIETVEVRSNDSVYYQAEDNIEEDTIAIHLIVHTMNRHNVPLILMEITLTSSVAYEEEQLFSIDLLEELGYMDTAGALGGVSANELQVVFRNDAGQFYFNNTTEAAAAKLKRNRRVQAWLGAVIPGETGITWVQLGTFWTNKWVVPMHALTASCTAFDTLGLIGTTEFFQHQVYSNLSVGAAIELVLLDAIDYVEGVQYEIDPVLYNAILPYVWFTKESHLAALIRIASAYPLNIYCKRDGSIMAAPREADSAPVDTWSDSTNVTYKEYPTLYTEVPNTIQVLVNKIVTANNTEVINTTVNRTFNAGDIFDILFTAVCIGNYNINISANSTLYIASYYSWGIRIEFTGTVTVNTIVGTATTLVFDRQQEVIKRSATRASDEGVIVSRVESDLIQDIATADAIATNLLQASYNSIYDAEVRYTGNIGVAIGDNIRLLDGVAPVDNYTLQQHELHWNGALTGTAYITTRYAPPVPMYWHGEEIWHGLNYWNAYKR